MSKSEFPPVFVINMAKDLERRNVMKERLEKAGLPFEFFEAINGYELDFKNAPYYDRKKRLRYFGRDLFPGEVGCLLSHRGIFEKMDKENIEYAVVLEDDVIFEDDIRDVLDALLKNKRHWDVIRFLGSEKIYKRGCRIIEPLTGKYHFARLPTTPGGAHGYLLTLKAARAMLKHMQKNWVPIDTLQGQSWKTKLETLVVHPAPLYPDPAADSTIGDDRFDKTVCTTGIEKTLFPLNRAWFKLCENIGKRYVYLTSWARDKKSYTT